MTINYTFCSLVSRLKNAAKHNKSFVMVPRTKFNKNLLECFYRNGYLTSFTVTEDRKSFLVEVKLSNFKIEFSRIRIISSATRKKYVSFKEICKLYKTTDFFFISTSKGIFSSQEAFFYGLGGEILFDNLNFR